MGSHPHPLRFVIKQIKIKPSDAKSWSTCKRKVWLDNKTAYEPAELNEFDQLIINLGLLHENKIFTALEAEHHIETALSIEHTQQLMNLGVDIIYQAKLVSSTGEISGDPDFLIRQANGDYQAADAKLSSSAAKKEIQIQLGLYRRLLENELPAVAYLGNGNKEEITSSSDNLVDEFIGDIRELLQSQQEPAARYSHSKCSACIYDNHCKPSFIENDDLTLLYGIQARAAVGLENIGIQTITDLSSASPEAIPDVPYLKGLKKKQRAVLQAKAWKTNELFQITDVILPKGTWVHFDIEDNPLTSNGQKHVYLWGFLLPSYSDQNFEYVWTNNQSQDEEGWIAFLEKVNDYKNKYPELILAHYSNHERKTIEHYSKRYDMESNEIVQWLLGDDSPLFDIQKPVTNNFVLPVQGYGLKDICKHKKLVNFQWRDGDSGSQWSVVQFNNFLKTKDSFLKEQLKTEILGYNQDDVMATYKLEQWLRDISLHLSL